MSKRFVSPNIFFFLHESQIGVWDYLTNQNWYLQKEYLDRILLAKIDPTNLPVGDVIDDELLAGGLLSEEPLEEIDWGWGKSAKIFHYGTKNFEQTLPLDDEVLFVKKYIDFCTNAYNGVNKEDLRVKRSGPKLQLPPPNTDQLENVSLWKAIRSRKTTRTFFGTPISLSDLSLTLYATFGEIHGEWSELEERGLEAFGIRKSVPSAGGIHCCNAYVLAINVQDLEPGVYHYESDSHCLTRVSSADYGPSLGRLVCGQQFAGKLSVGIFITAALDKIWLKYKHSRAYRMPYIDVGHLSQVFHLVANSIGLNSWLSGVFLDDEVSSALDLSPTAPEQPIFFIGMGNGNGDYLHPIIISEIAERRST